MAFPQDRLPIKQELYIDNTWTDITSRTRNDGDVKIVRGYSSAQASLSPGKANFTLENPDGFFSNKVPTSVNYGKIGRNIPFRTSITESTTFLKMADHSTASGGYDGGKVSTTDKAVLDITSDIDVRVDICPDNWRGGRAAALMSKYISSGNQRSWSLWLDRMGFLWFSWSTDGTTATLVHTQSTAVVSALDRQALRATLDVNNGSGGKTVTFYTSDTITGTWTQLGSAVTTTGTTSIHSGSAVLEVGNINNSATRGDFLVNGNNVDPFVGRVYGARVLSGIGGTLVANMDATSQVAGTTSWSDGLTTPNTWTVTTQAEITAQDYRFHGELSDIPVEWDTTGNDVTAAVTTYDLIGRLQQGSKNLHSAIYRNLIRYSSDVETEGTLDGYWTMENGSQATIPNPEVGRNGSMTDCTFSTDADFPGSEGVLLFSTDSGFAGGDGVNPTFTSNTGVVTVFMYFRAPAVPAGTDLLMNYYMVGGNVYAARISITTTTYKLDIVDMDGTSLLSSNVSFGAGAEPNQPIAMRIMFTQNGGNVDYEWGWYPVGGALLYGVSSSFAGTIGRPRAWRSFGFTNKTGYWISHVGFVRENLAWLDARFIGSTNAYIGERPSDRFDRLCREERIKYWIVGRRYEATDDPKAELDRMGAQTAQPFIALVGEIAKVDGGFIYGPRDKFGIALRMKNSIINRQPLELDNALNHLGPESVKPTGDLFFAQNDVTMVRSSSGGKARSVRLTGSLNVNEPAIDPEGIGTYDPGPQTICVYEDAQLQDYADEAVHLFGTWDELRYTSVPVELARPQFVASAALTARARKIDLFDPIRLLNLPNDFLPPDDVDLLVLGVSETLLNRQHKFIWNTAPYGPYIVSDMNTLGLSKYRQAATSSTLTSGINGSATSFTVTTAAGSKLWRVGSTGTDPTRFPMVITIGGEDMSVGQIAGTTSPQTFSSITRNTNNMATTKSHSAGASVQLRDRFYLSR